MPPGAWTDHGAALRAPIGPIHWAGAETARVWNGYMDGAVGSGEDVELGSDVGDAAVDGDGATDGAADGRDSASASRAAWSSGS